MDGAAMAQRSEKRPIWKAKVCSALWESTPFAMDNGSFSKFRSMILLWIFGYLPIKIMFFNGGEG